MNVNISKEAVLRARGIVQETMQALVNNHNYLNGDINDNLSQWQDANVVKFLQVYESMTQDLGEIVSRMSAVDNFCAEIFNWLSMYLD